MAHPGKHAQNRPDAAAAIMAQSGETLSWAELHASAVGWANHFHDLGLRPGDPLAFCLENRLELVSIVWACQYAGFRYTPISSRLTPSEVGFIAGDCDATVLVVSDKTADVVAGLDADGPVTVVNLDETTISASDTPRYERAEGWPMLYSSGTTGRPKGVRRPAPPEPIEEIPEAMATSAAAFGFDEDSVYLSTAPLYHSAPMDFLLQMTRIGATTVIMERFDPTAALGTIQRYSVTHSQWVPTMFVRMLALGDERDAYDLSSHRWAIHGAGPCTVATKEAMLNWWGPIIWEYYAGTEGSGLCLIGPDEWLTHKGSVGRSVRGPVYILDDDGNEVPARTVGQIWFGNSAEFEYHGDADRTAESRRADGTGTFGDIGYLDDDGYLYLTDRKSFTINVGGINVYPRETEEVLAAHPAVRDVAVFGVPNAEYGEEVKAVVQVEAGFDAGPVLGEELLGYCRDNIAIFKVPRSIDFVEEFPREPTGKVRVGELRKTYSRP